MDKGLINGVLFLDLKKAFDTVDHSILLQKMEKYGIKGTAHKLIKSYLSNRKQVCVHNNTKSNQKTVLCGIPQGSNLGPLLFSIYINDLPNCLKHTQASMFADDTNLTCTGSSAQEIEDKLNSDLCNVNRWLRANKLTLNNKKTKFMLIASKGKLNQISNNLKILANNSLIEQVKQKEVLGITIDQELNWKEHIDAQCTKLSSAIALLRRAKAFVTQTELIRMYNSLVFPYFTYCSNVWYDRNNRANIEKMYKMQKRAARVITSSNYEIRSKSIFQSLKWVPIELTLQKRVILMTSKAIRRAAPGYINNMFRYCNNSIYQMRSNRRKLALIKPRRNFMKKSFSYRGAVAWNNLPDNLTDNHEHFSIDHFKTSLDNYFNDLNDVN